jgi:hypothetical protein
MCVRSCGLADRSSPPLTAHGHGALHQEVVDATLALWRAVLAALPRSVVEAVVHAQAASPWLALAQTPIEVGVPYDVRLFRLHAHAPRADSKSASHVTSADTTERDVRRASDPAVLGT